MDPGINSPRIQSWNLTVEQQLGSQWGVAPAISGSHSDRLWAQVALNPAIYMGSVRASQRRGLPGVLDQREPEPAPRAVPAESREAASHRRAGSQHRRRLPELSRLEAVGAAPGASGVSLNGNYTLSRCKGTPTARGFNQQSAGYLKPEDPSFDAGYCDQDRSTWRR